MNTFAVAFFALIAVAAAGVLPGDERNAEVLRSQSEVNPDSYQWAIETSNQIQAQEQGQLKQISPTESAIAAQGSFKYTAPDGTPVEVQYVADENGFQPQGSHLPQPPPIPEAIKRALEWIAAHPAPPSRK